MTNQKNIAWDKHSIPRAVAITFAALAAVFFFMSAQASSDASTARFVVGGYSTSVDQQHDNEAERYEILATLSLYLAAGAFVTKVVIDRKSKSAAQVA